MMDYEPRQPTKAVEDYTIPFLWMAGLLLFMLLIALWAVFGFLAAVISAFFLRRGIDFLPRRE